MKLHFFTYSHQGSVFRILGFIHSQKLVASVGKEASGIPLIWHRFYKILKDPGVP